MQDNMRCGAGAANVETWTRYVDCLGQTINFGDYIFYNGTIFLVVQDGEPIIHPDGYPIYNVLLKSNNSFMLKLKWSPKPDIIKLTCSQIKLFKKLNK